MKFHTRTSEVEAVQWDGAGLALRDIQELIFPASPLYRGPLGSNLGIYVGDSLIFLTKGDYLVKIGETITILPPAVFERHYGREGVPA